MPLGRGRGLTDRGRPVRRAVPSGDWKPNGRAKRVWDGGRPLEGVHKFLCFLPLLMCLSLQVPPSRLANTNCPTTTERRSLPGASIKTRRRQAAAHNLATLQVRNLEWVDGWFMPKEECRIGIVTIACSLTSHVQLERGRHGGGGDYKSRPLCAPQLFHTHQWL